MQALDNVDSGAGCRHADCRHQSQVGNQRLSGILKLLNRPDRTVVQHNPDRVNDSCKWRQGGWFGGTRVGGDMQADKVAAHLAATQ